MDDNIAFSNPDTTKRILHNDKIRHKYIYEEKNMMLSDRLKRLRTGKKLKQAQVAEIVGVNKSAISAYENGLRQPSYEVLIRLASLYCVTTDYLLGRKKLKLIDASGLTDKEVALVLELISELTNGNNSLSDNDNY